MTRFQLFALVLLALVISRTAAQSTKKHCKGQLHEKIVRTKEPFIRGNPVSATECKKSCQQQDNSKCTTWSFYKGNRDKNAECILHAKSSNFTLSNNWYATATIGTRQECIACSENELANKVPNVQMSHCNVRQTCPLKC
eukprot:97943_1